MVAPVVVVVVAGLISILICVLPVVLLIRLVEGIAFYGGSGVLLIILVNVLLNLFL